MTISISRFLVAVIISAMGLCAVASTTYADHGDEEAEVSHAKTVTSPAVAHVPTSVQMHTQDTHSKEQMITVLTKLIALLKEKQSSVHDAPMTHTAVEHDHSDTVDLHASVALSARKGAMGNYDLHLEVDGFTFAPEHADGAHVAGEGHVHVLVDGKKAGRMYGPWMYLPALTPGKHTVLVSLATNDHKAYVHDEKAIEDSVIIDVQ